jgi:hypothetical protein
MDYYSKAENDGAVPNHMGLWDHYGPNSLSNPVSLGLTITMLCCVPVLMHFLLQE